MSRDNERAAKSFASNAFLDSPDARPLRILGEYLEPRSRFERYKIDDTIVFFGSSRIVSKEQAEAELEAARAGGGETARAEKRLALSAYYEATRELSRRLTEWSKSLDETERRFVVCSGGGPGIMEAANRGASEAKGINMGLGIALPMEEPENHYITRELALNFHYFFMRKFWFAYLAKAVVVMPGGFGTLDELFELLTLVQTKKIRKHMPVILFGEEYWSEVIDFEALANHGTINPDDVNLMFRTDSIDQAYDFITDQLSRYGLESPGATL